MDPFIGQLMCVGFNFAPRGWALCQGQLLAISQYQALFSLLGTMYGGDGRTTFGLPDLRGRVPIGFGQGPGLSSHNQGSAGGTETVALTAAQMPSHSHAVNANNSDATDTVPTNQYPAAGGAYTANNPNTTMNANMIGASGGNQAHQNMQPFLALNWIIALEGVYPSRS